MKHPKKAQNRSSKRPRRGEVSTSPDTVSATVPLDTAPTVAVNAQIPTPGPEIPAAPAAAATVNPIPPAASAPSEPPAGVAADVTAPAACSASPATRRIRALEIVKDHVPLAVGAAMLPVPGLDLAAIGGLQLKLLASLANHYQVRFTEAQAQLIVSSLIGSVGTTWLAGAALLSVAKFVPFLGTLAGAASLPVAGGVITRAMGHLAIDHFEAGGTMETFDLDLAQQAFARKLADARLARA